MNHTFNTTERKKMSRATWKIENIRTGNYVGYTPLDIANLNRCYSELLNKRKSKTILPDVVEVFAECGFTIQRYGTEWMISL